MDDKNLQYKRELGLNIKHYRLKSNYTQAVSYTHLTLPTIA